jgi:hypothetical protein
MSKLLLNLPVQISKALVNSKIQFLFRKEFLFSSGPVSPVAPPAYSAFRPNWSYLPNSAQQLTRPLLPTETSVVAVPVSRRRSSTIRAAMDALPPNASLPSPPLLLGHYFPPSSHALTHRDEPEITQPLNTTASPAVTRPSPPRCPSPSPIKGPPCPDGTLPHHQLVPSSSLSSPHHRRFESEPRRWCAAFQASVLGKIESPWRPPSFPYLMASSRGSKRPLGRALVSSMAGNCGQSTVDRTLHWSMCHGLSPPQFFH